MATPTRVVIVGGGFGGAYAARALEKQLRGRDVEITLVDRHNFFVFYPLLVEAGTGNLEPRHAVVAVRDFLKATRFRMAEVTNVDAGAKQVSLRDPSGREHELGYDHLVFALGSVTRRPNVPGLREHGYQVKTLDDAVGLRDRAVELLERADVAADPAERRALLHFVVVGGNFTGAEVAGEFDVFLKAASKRYRNVSARDCRVTLVEREDRILSALDPELSAYALRQMRRRHVDVRLETTVEEIREQEVTLSGGETLPSHTVIWCAGIAPNPLLAESDLPTDRLGYLRCTADLRVDGVDGVWGIGDSAANPDPSGKPYPATAQHAVRQAEDVARNIRRVLDGEAPKEHVFRALGSLAALGCRTGVARIFGIKLSGFPAWFMWRTVYLFKMPGWSRRIRVALDWTLSLFFRRDYVQLGVRHARADHSEARNGGSDARPSVAIEPARKRSAG